MEKQPILIYVTKDALTSGILETPAYAIGSDGRSVYFYYTGGYRLRLSKPNWHLTKEEALKRVEDMRRREIASLQRKLDKLSAIEFPIASNPYMQNMKVNQTND